MKITLLALFICGITFGQQVITGNVVDSTGEPIFNATILEKGTLNQVSTNFDGDFRITIQNVRATIIISFAGFEPLEFETLPEKDDYGNIVLVYGLDCYFPIRSHFTLAGNSGLFNNPFGAYFDLWDNLNQLKNTTRINANLTYQTDLDSDYYFRASAQLYEIQVDPDYSLNVEGSFEKIEFQESFRPILYSVEGIIKNADNLGLIAGGKMMRLNSTSFLAPTIGLTYDSYLWLGFSTSATVSFFKGNTQYNGRIAKDFGRIATFINYYKLQQFDELSIGLGYKFYY